MRCDIIMPVWNNEELTRQCLESIFANTNCDYIIIIIDNASDGPTRAYLEEIKKSHPDNVTLIRNKENMGFTKAVNQGFKASSGDYVCIINNDIIVFEDWLCEMMRVAEISKDIGIVNPANNFGKKKPWNMSYQQCAGKATAGQRGRFVETASPVGFCYLIKREVINKIGLFDERFNPGYYEDADYAVRAREAGFKAVFAKGAYVFHFEHKSFGKNDSSALFKRSEELFYTLHSRPQRILFILSDVSNKYYSTVRQAAGDYARDSNWCFVYLKKSAEKIELPRHTYIRSFYFADLFFNIKIISLILLKKKKFTKIFVDDTKLAARLERLKKYHNAEVAVIRV